MKTTQLIKLIADEGMILTDGTQFLHAVILREGMVEEDWTEITELQYKKIQAKMTPREFILALLDKGITREQIETITNTSSQVWAELNYATTILRINPLLDKLCGQFGLTSEDLDSIFGI